MVISQGEIWWAELASPTDSVPGYRRPVVIVQGVAFNRSALATMVVAPMTSALRWADRSERSRGRLNDDSVRRQHGDDPRDETVVVGHFDLRSGFDGPQML